MGNVRRLGSADVDAIAYLTGLAFGGEDPAQAAALQKAASLSCAFIPPSLCWGVELEGRLVAKWQLIDLTARLGRARLRVAGAHTVVVHPDLDGTGLVQELFHTARADVESLGFDIILGFAQRGALYASLGAVPVTADYTWSCDALRVPPLTHQDLRDATPDDVPALVRWYNVAHESRPVSIVRSAELWRWLLRKPTWLLVGEDGYIGLREGADALEVRELGWDAPSFAESALRRLASIARARGIRRLHGHLPSDHPMVEASIPYGAEMTVRHEKRAGTLAGVVRADLFLEKLSAELEARLSRSALCGRAVVLSLRLDDHAHMLEVGHGAGRPLQLDLNLTSGMFLQLAMGYRRPAAVLAQRALEGDVSAREMLRDTDRMGYLEALFPAGHPFVSHTDRW